MKLEGALARALALLVFANVAWAQGSRVLIKENSSLRSRPSMDSEIIAPLRKGQTYEASPYRVANPRLVPDEPAEWIELAAPSTARVWISMGLVDPATRRVRVDRANLRAGPGTNFAEVGQLLRGTQVELAPKLDGWIRIAAPPGAVRGFVDADVTAPATAGAGELPGAPLANRTRVPAGGAVRSVTGQTPLPSAVGRPVAGAGRVVPAMPSVSGRPLVVPGPQGAPPPPPVVPSESAVPVPAPVAAPAPAVEPVAPALPVPIEPVPASASVPPPGEVSIPAPSGLGRQAEIVFSNERPREVFRQGVVAYSFSPQAPGRFQLDSFRRGEGTLAFLIAEDPRIDLEKWRSKQVVIQGEEYRDARWRNRSVIKVKSIEAVP